MNTKPQNISELIAQVESDNNQYAMRYEPEFVTTDAQAARYSKQHGVSLSTAHVCLASSWGMFQIMGSNLFTYGLSVSLPHYCCDKNIQLFYFNKFLTENGLAVMTADYQSFKSSATDIQAFARAYNGPGNVAAYVARMKRLA